MAENPLGLPTVSQPVNNITATPVSSTDPTQARQGDVFAQTVDTAKIAQQTKAFDRQSEAFEAFKVQTSQSVQQQTAEAKRIQTEADSIKAQASQLRSQIQGVRSQTAQIKQEALSVINTSRQAYQAEISNINKELQNMQQQMQTQVATLKNTQPTNTAPKATNNIQVNRADLGAWLSSQGRNFGAEERSKGSEALYNEYRQALANKP
jgi:chromosome segregation ATPase